MNVSIKSPSPLHRSIDAQVLAEKHGLAEPQVHVDRALPEGGPGRTLQSTPALPVQAPVTKSRRWPSLRWHPRRPKAQKLSRKLEADYLRAFESDDMAVKEAYLDTFNADAAPKLITEEAALERLAMKHAYLKIDHGRELAFFVQRTLTGAVVHDYARRYVVANSLVDREHGVVAYLLEPKQAGHGEAPQWPKQEAHAAAPRQPAPQPRTILLFRGTNPASVMDPLCKQDAHPEGLAADADPQGVAYTAFAHNGQTLRNWVRSALQAGGQVTITGHSLGGALAERTVACLTPEEQARTHAVTFNAPGLDTETADRIVTEAGVRLVRMRRDPISKGGQKHPVGTIIKQKRQGWLPIFSIVPNHTTATLSSRELDGQRCEYVLREAHWADTSMVTEALRVKVGETMTLPA